MSFLRMPDVSRSVLWGALGALVASYLLFSRIRRWSRLSHVPGPSLAAWTDLWLIVKTWQGKVFHEVDDLCEKHGPLVRIAPNFVSCGDPHEVRRLWSVRSPFDRSTWWTGFRLDPPNECIISLRDRQLHATLRSQLSHGYAGKNIQGLHESIDGCVSEFVRLIEDKYVSTATDFKPVDLARKIQYLTMDVISTIAFGEPLGFIEKDQDVYSYIKTTTETMPMFPVFALAPWLVSLIQSPLLKRLMPSDTDRTGVGPIIAFAKSVVGKRFGPHAVDRRDMLGSFVRHGLIQTEAENESLVQIAAGSDTTAAAIRTMLAHILTNPTIYQKLQSEIDTALSSGQVSSPVTDAEARQLPYLQACIREGLRIWPPIPGLNPRVAAVDTELCGVPIPAGTNVAWSSRTVLCSKAIFGPDARMFRPERWVEADPDQFQAMENTVDLAFGQGRWSCLGKPIALIEINKVLVELFRRFDFEITSARQPIDVAFFGVVMLKHMNVRITRRDPVTSNT